MSDLFCCQQGAARRQQLDNRGIGFEDIHPGKEFRSFFKLPAPIHRTINVQTIGFPDSIILMPVPRRRMDAASALLQGDMIAENEQ